MNNVGVKSQYIKTEPSKLFFYSNVNILVSLEKNLFHSHIKVTQSIKITLQA